MAGQAVKMPVEDASINPHKCGGYMMINETQWADFVLSLDFKISKGGVRVVPKGWACE
mgnify:CR=1 FL=1